MDIETRIQTTPAPAHCPSCGRPDDGGDQVVSRHQVSFGTVLYTRCTCGRLRVRTAHPGPPMVR
ncbi:hypothetical protein O4J56_24580 [Nocardiopsis sp. RSe5-2]|uniref:Uncharacterized protein n=1 Tax=Nocardiopsis endophytica TaxID=3018445 RepID=A0ABT4UBU3_9ACTN|nr:hypothetical protein [Nocardiopsis endophytica]MDA2813845.1 hypothetical protein [Nocardiopsis endophytica]